MSREEDHLKLTADLINILRCSDFANLHGYTASHSRNASAALHNILSGDVQDVLPRSTRVPIYEDTHQSSMLHSNSGNFNSALGANNLPAGSNVHNTSSSSALEALQSYGQRVQSPSPHQWNDWNIDYDQNVSRKNQYDMEQAKVTKLLSSLPSTQANLNPMRGSESCMTSNDCTFAELDLKTVDDEDDFLYGDSNSMPESPRFVAEDSAQSNQGKSVTTWSDDEDPYDEPTIGFSKTMWSTQDKPDESTKLPQSRQERKVSSLAKESTLTTDAKDKRNLTSNRCSQNIAATRSKYHAAAEILKKQTTEKSKLMNKISSNEKVDIFSGSVPGTDNKDLSLKTNKPLLKGQRQLPKAFNQKHLDNIKDYIKRPERKRSQPHGDLGPESKYLKQESSTSLSPSKYNPAHDSKYKSPYHDYRERSPNRSRRKSPDYKRLPSPYHSRDRSPDYEHRSRHRSFERRRRYSRSPVRRSKKSRSRSRSPTRRSRTPPYASSRDKSYDKYKKSAPKSHRTPERHTKKKQKSRDSSEDSIVTLSLESESDSSSDSSDESSDEKRKSTSKQSLKKTASKDGEKNTKVDTKSTSDASFLPDDLSKNLVDLFSLSDKTTKDTDLTSDMFNSLNNEDKLNNIVKMLENNQLLTQLVEGIQQEHPSTLTSAATSEINVVSSSQMPIMSCPQIYSYPSTPLVPVQYMAPQVNQFPPMLSPATLPPPSVIPSVLSTEYDSYKPPVQPPVPSNRNSRIRGIPSGIVRSNLREITVSDSLSTTTAVDTNIKSVSAKPKVHDSVKSSVQESAKLSTHGSKQSFEKKSKEVKLKENEKDVSLPKPDVSNSTVLIGMFKKLKAERHIVHSKVKNTADDMLEMENKLQSTFGKKVDTEQKIIQSKCKTLLNITSDSFTSYLKDAKRADEELNKFKAKLPSELQSEVSKIKLEQCIAEETSEEACNYYDNGDHTCFPCNKKYTSIGNMLEHFHSSGHKVHTIADVAWMKHFKKEEVKKIDEKKASLEPAKGIEFLKPLKGYFCSLCNETLIDNEYAEHHIKSHRHSVKYKNHVKKNPAHEKRYEYSFLKNAQKIKEVTEINSDRLSSENKYLFDKVTAEKDKEEPNENMTCSIKPKNKTIHKFIFIGKAPNYKVSNQKESHLQHTGKC